MYIKEISMRFVNSLALITAPLEYFPKIFDLDTSSFSKGFFPHSFINNENLNNIGEIPDRKHFGKQVNENGFEEWYNSFNNKSYNLLQEAELYLSLIHI